jgi:hypothetical protein
MSAAVEKLAGYRAELHVVTASLLRFGREHKPIVVFTTCKIAHNDSQFEICSLAYWN